MRILVLDESLQLSQALQPMLAALGADASFVCSSHEFEMAERSHGPADYRIVNLGGQLTAWETSRQLRSLDPPGPTLVLFDEASAPGVDHVASVPRAEACLLYTSDAAD